MSASEGKDLAGIARSIDRLFSSPDEVGDDDESGVQSPPEPPNVGGDALTGAPVLPDMPRPEDEDVSSVAESDESPAPAFGRDVDERAQGGGDTPGDDLPPPIPDAAAGPDDLGAGVQEAEEEIESTPLDEAVDAYLDGDRGRADDIRRLAEDMLEQRELNAVARSVGRLAAAAGEPPDEEILALAESISSPMVLGRLAIHVGSERDEERREAFYRACRNLGEPMARAIRDDLAESTDRHARRVHCEALVEMGPVGRAMVEEMVMDENRFLVRNAVTILGDAGGDRAVELVTSALANPDARVRLEALRSLAKLGDEDSGDLVLGLLDDSDREVRIAAAVAAGELHVERALRHVIRMLDETKDPDEAIALVRALGHLGDPGAVPSIEKHAVRTLFSKPRTDVRIAAYRALHQIGTPHARRLLNQAVDDKEPAVKAAVKEMLGMR